MNFFLYSLPYLGEYISIGAHTPSATACMVKTEDNYLGFSLSSMCVPGIYLVNLVASAFTC